MRKRRCGGVAVHPRARGERPTRQPAEITLVGSSPRSRGTSRHPIVQVVGHRFIPALAGNVSATRRYHSGIAVHPRARGERRARRTSASRSAGSSPRSRGTLVRVVVDAKRVRFIPALAGNVEAPGGRRRRPSVHPRARGERSADTSAGANGVGSSPRSRGTFGPRDPRRLGDRFIPALAGNVLQEEPGRQRPAVHPRARGERGGPWARGAVDVGSSPRSRGTLPKGWPLVLSKRFIPALAGNVRSPTSTPTTPPVHPRARGERDNCEFKQAGIAGSSPRSRGTSPRRHELRRAHRFIPALAGNVRRSPS